MTAICIYAVETGGNEEAFEVLPVTPGQDMGNFRAADFSAVSVDPLTEAGELLQRLFARWLAILYVTLGSLSSESEAFRGFEATRTDPTEGVVRMAKSARANIGLII